MDAPAVGIAAMIEEYFRIDSTTYFLFRAASSGAQRTSLVKFDWFVEFCARSCPSGWQIISSDWTKNSVVVTGTTSHPFWERIVSPAAGFITSVDCPSCSDCDPSAGSCF